MFKEFFIKKINELNKRMEELRTKAQASDSLDEVRSINAQLDELRAEVKDYEAQLAKAEEEERKAQSSSNNNEQRGGVNPMSSYGQNNQMSNVRTSLDRSCMEYRQAFMEYVQRGTLNRELITRAGGDEGFTVTTDIGMLIPETVMNEIIEKYKGVYGTIYSKVRKLNIKGGVKFPIGDFLAKFHWITESTVSERQKAGDAKECVEFSYYIGEIRVANSLLSSIVSLPVFESEIADIILRAYLKEMDNVIINGTGSGQPLGVTKDTRVTQSVTMTAEQFADWKAWRTNLFAKIPLGLRGGGEFVFSAGTVEAHIATMHDDVNRPLYRDDAGANANLPNGGVTARFYGRNVQLVEPDILPDFDTAIKGDVVGILWNPQDYAINTNMQFGMRRYFDEETNQWVSKALVVVDGKMIDPKSCWLIKKG